MQSKLLTLSFRGIFVAIVAVFVAYLLTSEENETIAVWRQPSDIQYQSFDPYILVLDASRPRFGIFEIRPRFTLKVFKARDHDEDSMMYMFHQFAIAPFPQYEPAEFASKSKAVWTSDGLEFTAATGHRVLFPKALFIGGR